MGWKLRWVSSAGSSFNRDFAVSFPDAERATATYNWRASGAPQTEMPGISTFLREPDGTILHSYSTYGRGIEEVNGAYHLLDITAKGRDESALPYAMAWVRRHDRYAG
jgi:predicted dithiol-disulfide oxidoreductase (DUF899 family)